MRILFGTLLLLTLATGFATGGPSVQPTTRFQVGDNPDWAAPQFDDSGWSEVQPRSGNWWARMKIELYKEAPPEGRDLTVFVLGASEIYWDGVYIGRNGTVGTSKADEVAGTWRCVVHLDPSQTASGVHHLAVRVSSHGADRISNFFGGFFLGDTAANANSERRTTAFFMCFVGLSLFTGLLFTFLYFVTDEGVSTLLFGTLAMSVASLVTLEFLKFIYEYPYTWHLPRLQLISGNTLVVGVLLPAFLLWFFELPRRRPIVAGAALLMGAALLLVPGSGDFEALLIMRFSITLSFGLALWAVLARKSAGWPVLIGVTFCFVPIFLTGYSYADRWFFLGFVAMVLVLLILMGQKIASNERERHEARLRTNTLKYQLLQKSIQPHFLMNSLAVAVAWIEEHPARGAEMLRALSSELEAMFSVVDRNSISLSEEIELCQRHVATMGQMLDREVEFEVSIEEGDLLVPPGLLLTLVENAITHGDFRTAGSIVLSQRRDAESGLVFRVTNPLRRKKRESLARSSGAGFQYVRALLREAYGEGWTLDNNETDESWTTSIHIEANASLRANQRDRTGA